MFKHIHIFGTSSNYQKITKIFVDAPMQYIDACLQDNIYVPEHDGTFLITTSITNDYKKLSLKSLKGDNIKIELTKYAWEPSLFDIHITLSKTNAAITIAEAIIVMENLLEFQDFGINMQVYNQDKIFYGNPLDIMIALQCLHKLER